MHGDPLSSRLRHVYWIGGGSGAGKSTIARRLADRHGLAVYSTDDAMSDHAARCPDTEVPLLRAFQRMDMDERWVNRLPKTMLETFHWFEGEGFGLIVEDLLDLPPAFADQTDRLSLAQTDLCLSQHPNDLLRRKMLPCHSFISLKRVEMAGFA
jgi:hypothetical protein